MSKQGIALAHTTILRWVKRYVPEFERRWSRYSRTVGGSWRCDETYSALSSVLLRGVKSPSRADEERDIQKRDNSSFAGRVEKVWSTLHGHEGESRIQPRGT